MNCCAGVGADQQNLHQATAPIIQFNMMPSSSDAAASNSGGVALVTGATGIVGRYLVMHLKNLNSWKVYAVARRSPAFEEEPDGLGDKVTHIQVSDLLDGKEVHAALSQLSDVTHIFHCAYITSGSDQYKDTCDNLALLKRVVEAVEAAQAGTKPSGGHQALSDMAPASTSDTAAGDIAPTGLQHVYVQAGSKWYGQHWGTKYKTPAKETDPRYMTPNFYYDMVDYCKERQADGASWTWSSLLPNPVIGYSPGSYMNLMNAIAGYAAICKELDLPFRFPGSDAAYNALTDCCDARLLAGAIVFTSTTPAAANNIFNVSNGDVFRWSEVWPLIGQHFGLPVPPPQAVSLQTTMTTPDKKQAWERLIMKHNIQAHPAAAAYEKLIPWQFADFVFAMKFDCFQSLTKLRRAGFQGMVVDSAEMWVDWMKEAKKLGIFPL